ncbi:MAG: hypothetical protein ABIA37_01530 [Candidatus Woesearchaeota archaeon]
MSKYSSPVHLDDESKISFIKGNIIPQPNGICLEEILDLADQYQDDLILDILAQAASKGKLDQYYSILKENCPRKDEKFFSQLYQDLKR